MRKKLQTIFLATLLSVQMTYAGNPDRQGEAGAYELLMNPWARSSGLNGLNSSFVTGAEAMNTNIAGIARIDRMQVVLGHSRWLVPSGISINALGLATKVGKNGTLGISLMSLDFGDIRVTTTNTPEGTGASYSPVFFNLGIGYAHSFSDKISVGKLIRPITESITDISAFSIGIDAGVQYVAGENNQFKFGISLKNIGSPMRFGGDGLSQQLKSSEVTDLTYEIRPTRFELPSLLNIGVSYDIKAGDLLKLTPALQFTSHSFGRDELGVAAELSFKDVLVIRGAYSLELGSTTEFNNSSAHTGLALGGSLMVPLKKNSTNIFGIDYAFRPSSPFSGSHTIGLHLDF
jgi:hypothetical protein